MGCRDTGIDEQDIEKLENDVIKAKQEKVYQIHFS